MPGPLPAQQDAPFFSLNLPPPLHFSFDILPDTFARSYLLASSSSSSSYYRHFLRGCIRGASMRIAVLSVGGSVARVSYLYSHLHITGGVCLKSGGAG